MGAPKRVKENNNFKNATPRRKNSTKGKRGIKKRAKGATNPKMISATNPKVTSYYYPCNKLQHGWLLLHSYYTFTVHNDFFLPGTMDAFGKHPDAQCD